MTRRRRPRLNRKVYIETPHRTDNGAGGFTKTWADPAPVWAEMIPLRGEKVVENELLRGTRTWTVTIRWRRDILGEYRLSFEGKALRIVAEPADPDGRREWLVMTCESGVRT